MSAQPWLDLCVRVFTVYYAVVDVMYLALLLLAGVETVRYIHRRAGRREQQVFLDDLAPGVSLIVPARNEERSVVESVQALLALRYPTLEVVAINDGSTDGTLAALARAFDLRPVPVPTAGSLPCARVRGVYVGRLHPELTVVDKDNGGSKADALNAGLNVARQPLFCAVDADSLLEPDALMRVVRPFLDAPAETVAVGGTVRPANGCTVRAGRVEVLRAPRRWLERMQVVEYLRAFLAGRLAWSSVGALTVISGAFGCFRRDVALAAGGYRRGCLGEDAELVVRLHRYLRDQGASYRIVFVPDPVCWTEVPASLRDLARQRRRWQQGLVQTLWRHRSMLGRARYGWVGLLALPYQLIVEVAGAGVEAVSLPVVAIAIAIGGVGTVTMEYACAAVLAGALLSSIAILSDEWGFHRYRHPADLLALFATAWAEGLGLRWLVSFWRASAMLAMLRPGTEWGSPRRTGFEHSG